MKYKRQLMSSIFAITLLASSTSVFAADMVATTSKMVQQTNQVKMKSHTGNDKMVETKDVEAKDSKVKKVAKKNHKKNHKMQAHSTTTPITTPIISTTTKSQ